jgi:hypothetical protein
MRIRDVDRQIEKSPSLAQIEQIEMSLSTVLIGEFWADDGDCDEPDGDRRARMKAVHQPRGHNAPCSSTSTTPPAG